MNPRTLAQKQKKAWWMRGYHDGRNGRPKRDRETLEAEHGVENAKSYYIGWRNGRRGKNLKITVGVGDQDALDKVGRTGNFGSATR